MVYKDIKRLFTEKLLIDKAIMYATLTILVGFIIGPISMVLITKHMTKETQGFYYTFGSIMALQYIIELGMGQVIIQFVSHEWGKLSFNNKKEIYGDPVAFNSLLKLGKICIRWYFYASLIIIFLLIPSGYYFFYSAKQHHIDWEYQWILLGIGVSINICLMPFYYLLQGCNQVKEYWFYRFIQQLLYNSTLCIIIIFGAELWTLPISSIIVFIWGLIYLLKNYRSFVKQIITIKAKNVQSNWKTEIWPIQWKVALSLFSTYFSLQIFVPVLFRYSSAIEAGQMGMTLVLISAMQGIALNWISIRAPNFGLLISKKKFTELNILFKKSLYISILISVVSSVIIYISLLLLSELHFPLVNRILPLDILPIFFIATTVNTVSQALTIYLRAHKKEPMLWVNLLVNLIIFVTSIVIGIKFKAKGIIFCYFIIIVIIQLPLSLIVFYRMRNKLQERNL